VPAREKQIGRGQQQIPAQRSPMQRNGAGQSEVAIDKRIDPPAPALDISLHGVADDRASELLRG
jgi:hypothetical protein